MPEMTGTSRQKFSLNVITPDQTFLRNRREVLRDAFPMKDRIAALLRERPQTVPELARALQAPSHEVFIWLAAMLRYGIAEARGKANPEGYYTYALKEKHS